MGVKAFLAHPLAVAILGTVGSGAVTAGWAMVKDYQPLTTSLAAPMPVPVWAVAIATGTMLGMIAAIWAARRKRRERPAYDKRYKPSPEAKLILAALRSVDDAIDEGDLIDQMLPYTDEHVGRRDLKIAAGQLREAGWVGFDYGNGGMGLALMEPALAFCRKNDLKPAKSPARWKLDT